MAAIRTVLLDPQYVDQGMTPTYISATTFSVAGNQTSAIHADRRIKIFDATAGASTVIYATVVTASFTAVTTIQISADNGQLTSSLSSFALSIISKNNDPLPRNLSIYGSAGGGAGVSFSSANVTGSLSVGGSARITGALSVTGITHLTGGLSVGSSTILSGAVSMGSSLVVGGAASLNNTLSVGGATVLKGTLSVGAHVILAGHLDANSTMAVQGISVHQSQASFLDGLLAGTQALPNANWQAYVLGLTGNPAHVTYAPGAGSTAYGAILDNASGSLFAAFCFGTPTSFAVVGSISTNGASTSYNTTSDHRLKKNVTTLYGSSMIRLLRPVTFDWIAGAESGERVHGFIAHELQNVYPPAVTGVKDGPTNQMVDQSKLIPMLTAALQDALARIERLESRIAFMGG